MSYAAVILAAGRSRRMGRAKALVTLDHRKLIERVLAVCRGAHCAPLIVVLGHHAEQIRSAADLQGAVVAVNPHPDRGRTGSIKIGCSRVPHTGAGVIIFPVDLAVVGPEVLTALMVRHRQRRAPVVLPVHDGRRGHPILLDVGVLGGLEAMKADEPLNKLVHAYGRDVVEAPVETAAIHMDINTPEALHEAQAWLDARRKTRILETRRRARGE